MRKSLESTSSSRHSLSTTRNILTIQRDQHGQTPLLRHPLTLWPESHRTWYPSRQPLVASTAWSHPWQIPLSNGNHFLRFLLMTWQLTTFATGWRKCLSLLSNWHYRIYKALLDNDYFTGLVVCLFNLGVQHRFILQWWRKVLQVMLQKEEGSYNINRLWVIQLVEADINMYFWLIWGKVLSAPFSSSRLNSCRTIWLQTWHSCDVSRHPESMLLWSHQTDSLPSNDL